MQQALQEARRAQEEALTTRQWAFGLQRRAYSFLESKRRLMEEFGEKESALLQPPTPADKLGFLLA